MNSFYVQVRENGLNANKKNYRQNRRECLLEILVFYGILAVGVVSAPLDNCATS